MIRALPPVYSPLSARAVWAALGGQSPPSGLSTALLREVAGAQVVLTDSGTSALTAALRGAAVRRPGRPVALPGYGCFDLITAARGAGTRVLLYDLDPRTLQPDPESLKAVLRHEPAAVVFVHLYGLPVRVAEWREAVHAAGAIVIEDAAQGVGAEVDGRPVGTAGDVGILSFGRGKGLTAGGGGALVFGEDSELQGVLAPLLAESDSGSAVFVGKLLAQWILARPLLYGIPLRLPFLGLGETKYRPPQQIRHMSAQMQRVLAVTLGLAGAETARRRAHVSALLSRLPVVVSSRVPMPVPGAEAGWLRMPFRATHGGGQAALGCVRGYPLALGDLPETKAVLAADPRTPGAVELAGTLWTIPVHSQVSERDLERIAGWMIAASGGAEYVGR